MSQGTVGGGRVRRIVRTRRLAPSDCRGWALGFVAAVLLGLCWASLGLGAPGDLDSTFGTGGISITFGPQDTAHALIQQSDGKLVAAGTSAEDGRTHVMLLRYQADGQVDTAFGPGGKVITTVGSSSGANAMVLQSDGKLVVAGFSKASPEGCEPCDALLVRYGPEGDLDPSFGSGGIVTTDLGGTTGVSALVLQPDGKLVVTVISSGHILLARYLPDGRLDGTFGTSGKVITNLGLPRGAILLALQGDGKLVLVGTVGVTTSATILARYFPDGRLDDSFGRGGQVILIEGILFSTLFNAPSAIVIQPDGTLLVMGFAVISSSPSSQFLARFQPDGSLDPTFGQEGVSLLAPPVVGQALIRQRDGKLVVAGASSVAPFVSNSMVLARYWPDSTVDTTFGAGGTVITPIGGTSRVTALLQQADSNLVVAGSLSEMGTTAILLARYQALGCPTAAPEACLAQLEAFVTDVYQAALARQPDPSEVAYWVDVLTTTPTPDTVRGLLHVVFDSPEFRQRPLNPWQYVTALYQAMLGRNPSASELDWWVQAVLERFTTLLPAFLKSPEFQRLVPDCQDLGGVTLLVGRLYQQVLTRVPSWEEIVWWTQDIITWCALEEAVTFFFNTLDYLSQPRTLDAHVAVLYRALLAREPDAREQDLGVAYLAGQLAALEDEVMASPEFEAHVYHLFP